MIVIRQRVDSKLRENIGIFIENCKSTTLGQIKLCIDPVNKNPKDKFHTFDFSICKIVLIQKTIDSKINKYVFLITLLCTSKEAA